MKKTIRAVPRSVKAVQRRAGYTLVEVTMSTLIAGILLVTSMNMTGYTTRSQLANKDRARAQLVAKAMLAEIMELPYEDPNDPPIFGAETGEVRSSFDDVDDYNNLSDAPPVDKQGNAVAGGIGLTQAVTVSLADPENLVTTSGTDQGVKRLTVTVSGNGITLTNMATVIVK